jgi:hypothetical protein
MVHLWTKESADELKQLDGARSTRFNRFLDGGTVRISGAKVDRGTDGFVGQ